MVSETSEMLQSDYIASIVEMQLSNVVFPEPDGPMILTDSPSIKLN